MRFVDRYFQDFRKVLSDLVDKKDIQKKLEEVVSLLKAKNKEGKKIFLVGNGGSAAIAEHMATDLTKNAGLCASAFSGTPLLTTLANDFGYEKMYGKCIEFYASNGDVLIAISSGGASANIINACTEARRKGVFLITFTGFDEDNPVRKLGDINFWVNSRAYGYVELIHNLLIHCINDAVIGSAEYPQN